MRSGGKYWFRMDAEPKRPHEGGRPTRPEFRRPVAEFAVERDVAADQIWITTKAHPEIMTENYDRLYAARLRVCQKDRPRAG